MADITLRSEEKKIKNNVKLTALAQLLRFIRFQDLESYYRAKFYITCRIGFEPGRHKTTDKMACS